MPSYLLQLHTGSFLKQHTTMQEVREKLTKQLQALSIKAVIFGWNTDQQLNHDLLDFFHERLIPCYLWLPVFSEIDALKPAKPIMNHSGTQGSQVQIIEDESFTFFCPSQMENITYVKQIYEEHFSQLSFDGVFLDKIRYPSFANGYEEGFGCFCDTCRARFTAEGVSLPYLEEKINAHDPAFLKGTVDAYGHFCFDDPMIHHFYQTRASWITDAVLELIHYFHEQQKVVGLDIFAPFFAYHCGQDIEQLAREADFMKPMMYRYTFAPAGMQYEYDAFTHNFDASSAFCFDPISLASLDQQISQLKHAACAIYPGIEINPIEDICHVDHQKLEDNLSYFHTSFETLVCCWNCLLMDDSYLPLLQHNN